MEDDVLKLKEVVSVTFDTTPFFSRFETFFTIRQLFLKK